MYFLISTFSKFLDIDIDIIGDTSKYESSLSITLTFSANLSDIQKLALLAAVIRIYGEV